MKRIHIVYLSIAVFFFVLYLFVGEQSIVKSVKRRVAINRVEQKLEERRADIEQCRRDIRTMDNTDSLERYAREHYFMHADGEDVFLVED